MILKKETIDDKYHVEYLREIVSNVNREFAVKLIHNMLIRINIPLNQCLCH